MEPAEKSLKRYVELGRLGAGGMAEVLLARMRGPKGFERLVVIKRLLAHLRDEPDHVAMFLDEARLLSRIRHRNVVSVLELLEDDGEYALAMEYLEGESAAAWMKRCTKREELHPWLGVHVVAEAAAGLEAAHVLTDEDGRPLNLVHRDISPQNIFVTYEGEVKLLDFGVARADRRAARTETGVLKGKLAYMAPEQLKRTALDHRADVFALGIVLYELTTGVRLFHRDNELATVTAVCTDPIVPPSQASDGYPEGLEPIVMRALNRDPDYRYQSAEDLRRDLRAFLRQAPFTEDPGDRLSERMKALFEDRRARKDDLVRQSERIEPNSETRRHIAAAHRSASRTHIRPARPGKRRLWLMIAGAVTVLGVIVGVALSWLATRPDEPEQMVATQLPTTVAASEPARTAAPAIRIDVVTDPAGAEVTIGGADPCTAPCGVELTATTEELEVRGALAGHADARVTLTPDHAQTLRLTLTALPPAAVAPATPEPVPVVQPPPRRRRGRSTRRSAPPSSSGEREFPLFE